MVNKVSLVGKLLNEPELKETKKGIKVCNLTILTWKFVPIKNKNNGENSNDQEMKKIKVKHKVTCWGNRAQKAFNILKKGMLVYIDGELVRRVVERQVGNEVVYIPLVEIKANLIKRFAFTDNAENKE